MIYVIIIHWEILVLWIEIMEMSTKVSEIPNNCGE